MYQFNVLHGNTAGPYRSLAPPELRHRLDVLARHGPAVAVGAGFWGRPAGLALADLGNPGTAHLHWTARARASDPRGSNGHDLGDAHLHWVAVAPPFRGVGLGTALLGHLERELAGRSQGAMHVSYASGEHTPAWERLLQKRRWTLLPDETQVVLVFDDDRALLDEPWMHLELPSDCSLFPWAELTDAECASVKKLGIRGSFGPDVDPLRVAPERLHAASSFGLRRESQVVGWVLCEREGDVCSNIRLFVHPDLRRSGCGVSLLAAMLRSQFAQDIRREIVHVRKDNKPMLNMIAHLLRPYVKRQWEQRFARKEGL